MEETKKVHRPSMDSMSGHGGGDMGLIATFVEAVREGRQELLGITVDDVLNSHLTVRFGSLFFCFRDALLT